ncbi:hypothetical protein ACRE_036760 [Hapsidospora chrysogenum ATCC 11550]|uniref:MARVEL domain-containing protein n=1 Tax=Hapsidospora chrysogenum (strain ATCC 11550 / CBS 779.69 / DSM 880 / IAM 14645 / JCM 23072 / IMI 49137) TaxID=857340 RepID=A0A086T7Y0_HAPC1|nr:hypothetical protein ACRE_036760 [Hapsidospora chrysogenum ATCC 11550]
MVASGQRAPGEEHIPRYPPGFIALRVLQLIVGLVCLGLSAYTLSIAATIGGSLAIFTSVVTVIVGIWETAAHSCAKRAYNYWAILAFDIILFIFWLVSFALCAIAAAVWLSYYDSFDYSVLYDFSHREEVILPFGATLAALAGLGALNCLFFFISLVIDSIVTYRHRRAGLHSKPGVVGAAAVVQPYQMASQTNPNYAAVPQQGIPFDQQQTAYTPNAMYSAPMQQQQPYYSQSVSPMPSQTTGSAPEKPASPQPPQGSYQAPYQGASYPQ